MWLISESRVNLTLRSEVNVPHTVNSDMCEWVLTTSVPFVPGRRWDMLFTDVWTARMALWMSRGKGHARTCEEITTHSHSVEWVCDSPSHRPGPGPARGLLLFELTSKQKPTWSVKTRLLRMVVREHTHTHTHTDTHARFYTHVLDLHDWTHANRRNAHLKEAEQHQSKASHLTKPGLASKYLRLN